MASPLASLFKDRAYQLGITNSEIAERLGVTIARVYQLWGSRRLREDTIHKLCEVLGCELVLLSRQGGAGMIVTSPVVPRAATPVHETARECSILHGTIVVDEGVGCGP